MKILLNKNIAINYNFDYKNINSNLPFEILFSNHSFSESFYVYRSGLSINQIKKNLEMGKSFDIELVGGMTFHFSPVSLGLWNIEAEHYKFDEPFIETITENELLNAINNYWDSIAIFYNLSKKQLLEIQESLY